MKSIAKNQTATAQEQRANHRQTLIEISKEAKEIRHAYAMTDTPTGFVWKGMPLNQVIIRLYQERTGAKTFKTWGAWHKEGYRIRKGAKAFPIWGAAEKESIQKRLLDTGNDSAHWFTLWPIAYLYHEGQVCTPAELRQQTNDRNTEVNEVAQVYGIPKKAKQPKTMAEVKLSFQPSGLEKVKIGSSKDAADFLRTSVFEAGTIEHREYFYILLLNRANVCHSFFKVSEGGISATVIDNRLILQAAILSNASGIILAHNHPSGNMNPSESDVSITKKIKMAASMIDIQVLDHLIIGAEDAMYSFANEGII